MGIIKMANSYVLYTVNETGKKHYIKSFSDTQDKLAIEFAKTVTDAAWYPVNFATELKEFLKEKGVIVEAEPLPTDLDVAKPMPNKPIDEASRKMYGIRVETFNGTWYYSTRNNNHIVNVQVIKRAARLCKAEADRVVKEVIREFPSATVFKFPLVGGA